MKTLDLNVVESLFELDHDTGGTLILEMIAAYKAEFPEQHSNLNQHVGARIGASVASLAHALRSTFANFGSVRIAAILQRIETAGKANEWGVIDVALAEMTNELQNFEIDLKYIEARAKQNNSKQTQAS